MHSGKLRELDYQLYHWMRYEKLFVTIIWFSTDFFLSLSKFFFYCYDDVETTKSLLKNLCMWLSNQTWPNIFFSFTRLVECLRSLKSFYVFIMKFNGKMMEWKERDWRGKSLMNKLSLWSQLNWKEKRS